LAALIVYLVMLFLLIPWYWPAGDMRQLFGFPLWALTSLAVLLATAVFTAWLCLRKDESGE
jgi:hypothetical protein